MGYHKKTRRHLGIWFNRFIDLALIFVYNFISFHLTNTKGGGVVSPTILVVEDHMAVANTYRLVIETVLGEQANVLVAQLKIRHSS